MRVIPLHTSSPPVILVALWLYTLITPAGAAESELCARSCENCLKAVRFADINSTLPVFTRTCLSRLALSSHHVCLDVFCGQEARQKELSRLNASCWTQIGEFIPRYSTNFSSDEIAQMRRVNLHDAEIPHESLSEVIIPSSEYFTAWFETLDAYSYVKTHHFSYGSAMVTFWLAVVCIGALNRVYLAFTRIVGHKPSGSSPSSVNVWLRRNIILPATFGRRCAENVWWATIPSRIQTLTIFSFFIITIGFSIHGYSITKDNLYFSTTTKQILRYVSDRTGIMSFANFPIIWLFGMRNNVAIWLTGWDYGTYSNFHRWCARIATAQAIAHSLGYTILVLIDGGWTYFGWWFTQWFWNAGIMATICMAALLPLSVYWLRRTHYEFFLITHIFLSILVLLTMLGHVSIFRGKYDGLFWVPVFIWALDRVLRLARILIFNTGSLSTIATAIYNPSQNIIHLSVPIDKALYKPQPGTYYYIMFLNDSRIWESHPFTAATISNAHSGEPLAPGESLPLLESTQDFTATNTDEATHTRPAKRRMNFLIRPYDGFTSRLRDLAASEFLTPIPLRVLIDGPYGHMQPLERYDHVLFIAGGTGIVVPLAYMKGLCGKSNGPTILELHWSVREASFAEEVFSSHMDTSVGSDKLSVHVYIPSGATCDYLDRLPPQIYRHHRRLNIHSVTMSAAAQARCRSLAVVACGPAKMADDARHAVVEALNTSSCHIDYFVESFTW